MTIHGWVGGCLVLVLAGATAGCGGKRIPEPDFGVIYNQAAQSIGDERTPVIVIPGILGSKLADADASRPVWGAFTFGAADADTADGARAVALPMRESVPLAELRDDVRATTVLDTLTADIGLIRNLKIGAYVDILTTLAAGDYRDQTLGEAGVVDYGGAHYTCFQLAYDWRRDVSEMAVELDQQVRAAQVAQRVARGLPDDAPIKVDVIAHSMGGLVLRYYLRYGTQPLPENGSLPELTWAGAEHVDRAILIGTPNAGSAEALVQLVEGLDLNPFFPNYRPALLGTMPAIYQLLPRARHASVVDESGTPIDVFDVRTWEKYGWGLASPDQDRVLRWLLPEFDDPEVRRRIALDHLAKCLDRAQQFHRALDVPAKRPDGLELYLFAGDAYDTPGVVRVDARGGVRVVEMVPGDETVARTSAVMDERVGGAWRPYLRSPVDWSQVFFVHANHLGLTRAAAFVDNVLFLLLEKPRAGRTLGERVGPRWAE